MRIATIDVGTNTAKLLVADTSDGALRPLATDERYVRLGEGVDATGRVGEEALVRLRTALHAFQSAAAQHGAEVVALTGTSAARDADNRQAVVEFVREETGLTFEIIAGEEEAAWSFAGAASAFDDLQGRCVALDIGGGSTEVIVGDADGTVEARRSLDVGTVRLTERYFSSQPPAPREAEAATAFTREVLSAAVDMPEGAPLIGAAGTATALARVHLGDESEKAALPLTLAAADVRRWRERLLGLTPDEVLALHPDVMAIRADVFPAGVLILDVFMQQHGFEACRVSPRGLRHGLALRWMARRAERQQEA